MQFGKAALCTIGDDDSLDCFLRRLLAVVTDDFVWGWMVGLKQVLRNTAIFLCQVKLLCDLLHHTAKPPSDRLHFQ